MTKIQLSNLLLRDDVRKIISDQQIVELIKVFEKSGYLKAECICCAYVEFVCNHYYCDRHDLIVRKDFYCKEWK